MDATIAARHRAMQTARATMEAYIAADGLRGARSHPGTTVPFVEVGQAVWFHRDKHGCLQGRVHSIFGRGARGAILAVEEERRGATAGSELCRREVHPRSGEKPLSARKVVLRSPRSEQWSRADGAGRHWSRRI